jgi:uncharacterized membrane protein
MNRIYRPTVLTLIAFGIIVAAISGTTGYILGRAPTLPGILPIHFDKDGIADQFVRASYSIILVPVWIQCALALVCGAIAGVLLYRTQHVRSAVETSAARHERERMLMTAEAVSLLAAIWVSFQGLLAIQLLFMWQKMCCGLGAVYYQSLVIAAVASIVIGIRAAVYVRHPPPVVRDTDTAHWWFRGIYVNRNDPALFVPLRGGMGWTLNLGRPQAVVFVGLFVGFTVWAPVKILLLLLGE